MEKKKKIFVTFSLAFAALLILGLAPGNKAHGAMPKVISWATMPMGSSSYVVTAGLTKVVPKYTGMRVSVEPTRGVRDWGPLMKNGEIQFANLSVTSVMFALLGKPPFKQDPYKFIRLVSNGHTGYQSLYAKKGSGINSVRDLKGKRYYAGPKGHIWGRMWSELLLKGHGLEKKDVDWLVFSSPKEALKDVIEGRADAFMWALSPLFLELKSRVGGYPITIEESAARYVEENLPGMYMDTAPKGYMMLESDYLCTSFPNSLWTSIDVSEEVVYNTVKALYDHYDEYKTVHKNLQLWSLENATKRIAAPLHPGAIKYYKEKGVWTPELEATQQKLLKSFSEVWGAPVSN